MNGDLDDTAALYNEVLEMLQEAIADGANEDTIASINDELAAIAQTYDELAASEES